MREFTKHVNEMKDGNHNKRFPAGVNSLLYAIEQYWTNFQRGEFEAEAASLKDFCDPNKGNFFGSYVSVTKRWPNARKFKQNGLYQHLSKLGQQDCDINYAVLAAFSQHCQLPTALLLLYSRLVSMEMEHIRERISKEESRKELNKFIEACMAVLLCAQRQINEGSKHKGIFNYMYPSTDQFGRELGRKRRDAHLSQASRLWEWSITFNNLGAKFIPQSA